MSCGNCDNCQCNKVEPMFNKVINYPNRFGKYLNLDDAVQSIIKDRGNKFRYRQTVVAGSTATISCALPSGIILTGTSFFNPNDENFTITSGLKIAAGRLEGSLQYFERLSQGKRFWMEGEQNPKYVSIDDF